MEQGEMRRAIAGPPSAFLRRVLVAAPAMTMLLVVLSIVCCSQQAVMGASFLPAERGGGGSLRQRPPQQRGGAGGARQQLLRVSAAQVDEAAEVSKTSSSAAPSQKHRVVVASASKFSELMAPAADSSPPPSAGTGDPFCCSSSSWPAVRFGQTSQLKDRVAALPDDPCPKDQNPPRLHDRRILHYGRSLLSAEQVARIRESICPAALSERKSRCAVAVEDGVSQDNDLARVLVPLLKGTILPWAREVSRCPNLVVADALVRAYEGRETLAPHYDVSAFCTAVLPLINPNECYGGLYVQSGASDKKWIEFEAAGDALLHRYDVMHGVHVRSGERYSLVVWFAEGEEAMVRRTVPWVERERGDSVHAAFIYANCAKAGLHNIPRDENVARRHYEWAAERGHALAQYCLAMLLMKRRDNDDRSLIIDWLEKASARGLASAQHQLGITWKEGYLGVQRNHDKARSYLQLAANQGYATSIEVLDDPSRWN